MLLLNRTLLHMAKGLWRWIFLITALKLAVLAGLAAFAGIISGFLGNIASPAMTMSDAGRAVLSALLTAAAILLLELLTGEAEYRCTAKARQTLRTGIFSKVLELDVGNIEKIGPVSAITSSVDGVESMQVYYSQYLPGLLYSLLAPVYLFFRLREVSLIRRYCFLPFRFCCCLSTYFPPSYRKAENGILGLHGRSDRLLHGERPGTHHL